MVLTLFDSIRNINGEAIFFKEDLKVDKDNYLLELSRYIHLNPVKAGLVKRPEDYNWSSYRVYAYKQRDVLVDSEAILSQFRAVSQDENENYKDFVNEKLEQIKEEKDWLKAHIKRQRFLGDKSFIKKILGGHLKHLKSA